MKAVLCTKYGPPEVLQLRDVAKPVPRSCFPFEDGNLSTASNTRS